VKLRPVVLEALDRHRLAVTEDDTPATLRDRLNDRYLAEVRALRARQRAGEIPLAEYAGHARDLQERYRLLGLPLELWLEPPEPQD
jgi:hypothetical protein